MIISHKYQTVFVHIPKCAGTSIRNMILNADPDAVRFWGWTWLDRHQRYGDSAHIPLVELAPMPMGRVREYTTVTLSRDPVARFLSAVPQHLSQHPYRSPKTPSEILAELTTTNIRYNPAYIHFCPQHYFIYIGRKRHIDHVISIETENWEDALVDLLAFQGFPRDKLKLPKLNAGAGKKTNDLSDADLRRLYQLYKRDFYLLGYEPPLQEEFHLNSKDSTDEDLPHDFSAYDQITLMNATFRKGP